MVVQRRRWHRSGTQILCGAALAVGLTACAAANGTATTAGNTSSADLPVVTHVPRLLASVHLKLPLDAYLPSVREVARYGLANRELIRRCMVGFGIDVELPSPRTGVGLRTWTERRYGLTDMAAAEVLGYGLGSRDPSAQPETHDPELPPKALAVLTGSGSALPQGQEVPAGGCSGQAQRTLAGNPGIRRPVTDPYLAQQLSQESFQSSQHDPRVLHAFSRWSLCMRAKGHQYTDPIAPFSDPTLQNGPSPKTIHTAVDDVACKRTTNLVGIWYAVESAYQNELIRIHQADLEPIAAANSITASVIASVLDGSTTGN